MKKPFGKRIISILLSLCIVLSFFSGVMQKQPIEAEAVNPIAGFFINQLLTRGMQAGAFALSSIADSVGNDGFTSIVNTINKWVFGVSKNDNSAQFAALSKQMEKMCDDILQEMNVIQTGVNDLQSAVNKLGENAAYEAYLNAWNTDVENRISSDMQDVMDAYELYLKYANSYATQEATVTVNGSAQIASEQMVMIRKIALLSEFADVAGIPVGHQPAFDGTADVETLKDIEQKYYALLFDRTDATPVDNELRATVSDLLNPLVTDSKGSRFIDRAAQVAYYYFPYSDQQAEFVDASVRRQASKIYITLLIYHEFLALREEYYQQTGKSTDPVYQELQKNCVSSLNNQITGTQGSYENGVPGRLIAWMDEPVYITAKSYLYLHTYMRSEDVTKVTLHNAQYVQDRDIAFYRQESGAGRVATAITGAYDYSFGGLSHYEKLMSTTANITTEAMSFLKRGIVVVPENGGEAYVQTVMILQDETADKANSQMSKINIVKQMPAQVLADIPSADYYNLTGGIYSDGVNTYTVPKDPNFLKSLFNNSFLPSCNKLYDYMAEDLNYPITANTSVYMLTGNPTASGMIADTGTEYAFIDMTAKIDTWQLAKVEYDALAGGASLANAMYVCMLTNSATSIFSKIDTVVSGSGNAIVSVDGVSAECKIQSGTMTNINIVPGDHTTIESVEIWYHNDATNPTAVSRTELLVSDGSVLEIDPEGNVKLNYQVPYTNVTIVVNTEKGHSFNDVGVCSICGIYEPAYVGGQYGETYEIAKPGQLYWFAALVNGDYENAELPGQITNAYGKIVKPLDMSKISKPWRPIGKGNDAAFNGLFDGGFQPITNLDGMLFGTVDTAVLQNIAIESGYYGMDMDYAINSYSKGSSGSIAGVLKNSDMRMCYSNAIAYSDGASDVGGLVGTLIKSTMTDCYYAGMIGKFMGTYVGGLVGRSHSVSLIENCHVYAYVIGGGLVGYSDMKENSSWILNSYYNTDLCEGFYVSNALVTLENPAVMQTEDFTGGKVAYLLNAEREETVWGQKLGVQEYPVLSGPKVYKAGDDYSNDLPCGHDWADATCTKPKTCKLCGATDGEPLGHSPVIEYYNGYNVIRCERCSEILKTTDKSFKINSAFLTLSSDISVIYRATIPADFENAYMVFNVNGKEYTTTSYDRDETGKYLFSYPGINPQMMTDNISTTLYATVDGMQVSYNHANYSVLQYCNRLMEQNSDDELKNLISDLLVYGAASQMHVGYKTDALVTDLFAHELSAGTFPGVDAVTNRFALVGGKTDNDITNAALNLSNKVVLRFGFTISDTERSKYTVKITMSGNEFLFNASDLYQEDGKYWINFSEFSACQFDSLVTVCLMEGDTQVSRTLTYSVNSYIANNGGDDSDFARLLQSVYNYGVSAREYVVD